MIIQCYLYLRIIISKVIYISGNNILGHLYQGYNYPRIIILSVWGYDSIFTPGCNSRYTLPVLVRLVVHLTGETTPTLAVRLVSHTSSLVSSP